MGNYFSSRTKRKTAKQKLWSTCFIWATSSATSIETQIL